MNRIRVALVITELEVGGAERCLTNLARGLDPARFEVAVHALAARPAPDKQQLVALLEAAGIPVHFVGVRSPFQLLSAVGRLRRQLRAQRPDIVQTFLFHANVVGALSARRLAPAQVVAGVRVADPSCWRRWVERGISRYVRKFVCVSQSVADWCVSHVGLPPEKLLVIPNGIDVERYGRPDRADLSACGVRAGQRTLVYAGRLDRQKGVDWFLSLCPNLLAALPDHDVLLIGDGPQRAALEAQAAALGIQMRVRFAGWRPDVPELLAASSIAVLPSRWEGMPNFLLEAMAAARPVVSTRAAGVEEVLGPLAADQSVPVGDGRGFVAAILQIARDANTAARLGRENRQRVTQHFSLQSAITAYDQLYCRLTENLGKLG